MMLVKPQVTAVIGDVVSRSAGVVALQRESTQLALSDPAKSLHAANGKRSSGVLAARERHRHFYHDHIADIPLLCEDLRKRLCARALCMQVQG